MSCGVFEPLAPLVTECSGEQHMGAACVATCSAGYAEAAGSGTYTCSPEGEWTGEGLTCEDIDECAADNGGCGASPWVNTAGSFSCDNCEPGFVMGAGGCEPQPCEAAAVANSDRAGNPCVGVTGETCPFVCDAGFTQVGVALCTAEGTFTVANTPNATDFGRCEANECTEGRAIPNSNRNDENPCAGHTGDACDFVCNEGTHLSGSGPQDRSGQAMCGTDGAFAGGSCDVVDCGSTINGLDPHASATCEGDTGFGGDECVATCNEGFRANADALAYSFTCGADGQWAGELACSGASNISRSAPLLSDSPPALLLAFSSGTLQPRFSRRRRYETRLAAACCVCLGC